MSPFLDGKYILALVGSTNGVLEFYSFGALKNALRDMYPNPGDPTLAYLLNPTNWNTAGDDMPYFTEVLVPDGERDDYRLSVYRVIELES